MLKTIADLWNQAPVWRYTTILAMVFTLLHIIRIPSPGQDPAPILKQPTFSNNVVLLEWSGIHGFQGSYVVKRKANLFYYEEISAGIKDLKFNDQNVKYGEKYTYKVEAINGSKRVDSSSADIQIPTPSFKITTIHIDARAVETSDTVALKFGWGGHGSLNLDGVREFVLYENGTPMGRVHSPTTSYEHQFKPLSCGEQYTYRIVPELVDGKIGEALERKYSLPLPKPSDVTIESSNPAKLRLTWKWPEQCKYLLKNFEIRRSDKRIATTTETKYDIDKSEFCYPVDYSVIAKDKNDVASLQASKTFFIYENLGKLAKVKCVPLRGEPSYYDLSWGSINQSCSFKTYRIEKWNNGRWDTFRDLDGDYIGLTGGFKYRLFAVNKNDQPGEATIVDISSGGCEIK